MRYIFCTTKFTYEMIILSVVVIGQHLAVVSIAQSCCKRKEVISGGVVQGDHCDPDNDDSKCRGKHTTRLNSP